MAMMADVRSSDQNFVSERSCSVCGILDNLKCCGKCRNSWYCSREHQTQDWKIHKKICCELLQTVCLDDGTNNSGDRISTKYSSICAKDTCGPTCTNTVPTSNRFQHPTPKKYKSCKQKTTPLGKPAEYQIYQGKGNDQHEQVATITTTLAASSSSTSARSVKRVDKMLNNERVDAAATISGSDTSAAVKANFKTKVETETTIPKNEYDPRPYRPIQFPAPQGKDIDSLAKHIAEHLQQDSRCIVNDMLPINVAHEMRGEVEILHKRGNFIDGPLSGGKTSSDNSKKYSEKAIRSDQITWLQGNESDYPNICNWMKHLDCIVQKLNYYIGKMCSISGRTKAMVACYPGNGTGYAYHVDNPNKDGRRLTFLFYLNDGWDVEKHGGLLRLMPPNGDYVDVEPILNRLLVFWSDMRNPHEVQPAWASRYAITMWYFDKKEREAAKAAQLNEDIQNVNKDLQQTYVKIKEAEKAVLENKIKQQSQQAVGRLTEKELEGLAVLVEGSPNPRHMLTEMKVAPEIQDALLTQLEERRKKQLDPSVSAGSLLVN